MISFQSAVRVHDRLIEEFGGSKGVRDESLLKSALNRPFATFDGIDLYRSSIEKATALFESLIIKLMEILLRLGGLQLEATKEDKYSMVINASTGQMRFDDIKTWLEQNSNPL